MKSVPTIILAFLLYVSAYSQVATNALDTILLNTGRIAFGQITDTVGGDITIIDYHKKKHKKLELAKEAVFSIRFGSTGKEEVFYTYDTLVGNDFTVDDARKFIAGEQDAQSGFHAVGTSIGAFVIGFASGAYMGNIFAFAPPFFYDGIMTYPAVHVRHKTVRDIKIANTDPYLYGYYMVASRKRMLKSFLWSGVGLVSGLVVYGIFYNNN